MTILISEKNGCAYTWNHEENILMYTPLLENDTFNILYELKEILK